MNNLSSINMDPNAVFLRNRELQNHYKKINEIKSRKNKFVKQEKVSYTSQSKKRLNQNFDLNQVYNINRDNKALFNKLLEISGRENHGASHSVGKVGLKNNLLSYKKNKDHEYQTNNILIHNPLMTDEEYIDEGIYRDEIKPTIKETILPSIYMNNPNKAFRVIEAGDVDYEPFEKLSKNTKGFENAYSKKEQNFY